MGNIRILGSEEVRQALPMAEAIEGMKEAYAQLSAGVIDAEHIQTELGEIALGLKPGRTDRDQITYFKSVGVAVQDAVAGRIALRNAIAGNLGTVVSL